VNNDEGEESVVGVSNLIREENKGLEKRVVRNKKESFEWKLHKFRGEEASD